MITMPARMSGSVLENLAAKFLVRYAWCIVIASMAAAVADSKAASMVWNGPQDISGDTDVSTQGVLVQASNLTAGGIGDVTVNGVTFTEWTLTMGSNTQGVLTLNPVDFPENAFGSTFPPFSNLSASYQKLLATGGASGNGKLVTLTISGLTIGDTYQFQFWSNNAGGNNIEDVSSGGSTIVVSANTGHLVGSTGQWATGTFTADGATQAVTFQNEDGYGELVNAVQLRDLTVVPEPSSIALLFFGGAVLFWKTRRSRQSGFVRPALSAFAKFWKSVTDSRAQPL